jgi:hypothetical protein
MNPVLDPRIIDLPEQKRGKHDPNSTRGLAALFGVLCDHVNTDRKCYPTKNRYGNTYYNDHEGYTVSFPSTQCLESEVIGELHPRVPRSRSFSVAG